MQKVLSERFGSLMEKNSSTLHTVTAEHFQRKKNGIARLARSLQGWFVWVVTVYRLKPSDVTEGAFSPVRLCDRLPLVQQS